MSILPVPLPVRRTLPWALRVYVCVVRFPPLISKPSPFLTIRLSMCYHNRIMPNKRYIRGRSFEYRAAAILRKQGYIVTRAASSKGVFDLIAVGPDDIKLLQVKSGARSISKKELEIMVAIPVPACAVKEVWWFPGNRKPVVIKQV